MTAQNHQSSLGGYIQDSSAHLRSSRTYKHMQSSVAQEAPHQCRHIKSDLLANALHSLQKLDIFVAESRDLSTAVAELAALVQAMQFLKPRHELVQPLKSMLFHFPARFIPMIKSHPVVMLLMAYLHAITLFIEPAPDVDLIYFQYINVAPIETFYEEFSTRSEISSGPDQEFYKAVLSLMQFPLEVVEYTKTEAPSESLTLPRAIQTKGQDGIKSTSYIITVIENFTIGHWDHMLGAE